MIKDYKDWKLVARILWVPKSGKSETVTCTKCSGGGRERVWSLWGDDEYVKRPICKICRGIGYIPNPDIEEKPPYPEEFAEEIIIFMKKYLIQQKDFSDIIKNAIDIQNDKENSPRFLYCIISDLTNLDYNESKKLLHRYCQIGLIKCDSNFYYGTILNTNIEGKNV